MDGNFNKLKEKSICFILPGWVTKSTGGAEWQAYLLTNQLVRHEWCVEVITAKCKADALKASYVNPKIKYYYYPIIKIKIVQFYIAIVYILKTKSLLYYTRTDDRIFRAACSIVCKLKNRKMVYAIAGDDELEYNKFSINKDSNLFVKLFKMIDYGLTNIITSKSENRAALIISQTYYQQQKLIEKKGLHSIVIRNSYILDKKNEALVEKENLILWIGNFRIVKRPELFVQLVEKVNLPNYRFVMIGENSNYSFNSEIPSNLKLAGILKKENVLTFLKRAKILINTSITEGFPNTFLEAWANNVFVMSLDVNPDNLLVDNLGYCSNGNFDLLIIKLKEFALKKYYNCMKIHNYFIKIENEFNLEENTSKFINAIFTLQ